MPETPQTREADLKTLIADPLSVRPPSPLKAIWPKPTILTTAQLSETEALLANMFTGEDTNRKLLETLFACSFLEDNVRTTCVHLAAYKALRTEEDNDGIDYNVYGPAFTYLQPITEDWLNQDCVKEFEKSTKNRSPFDKVQTYAAVIAESMGFDFATNILVDEVLPATGEKGKVLADKIDKAVTETPPSQFLAFNHIETGKLAMNEGVKKALRPKIFCEFLKLECQSRSTCMEPLLSTRSDFLQRVETRTVELFELRNVQAYFRSENIKHGKNVIQEMIDKRAREMTVEQAIPIFTQLFPRSISSERVVGALKQEVLPVLRTMNDDTIAVGKSFLTDIERLEAADRILTSSRGNRARTKAVGECRVAYDNHNNVAALLNAKLKKMESEASPDAGEFNSFRCLLTANEADEIMHNLFEAAEVLTRVMSKTRANIYTLIAKRVKVED